MLRVALFALIGAAATVAVAWGCAWVPWSAQGTMLSAHLSPRGVEQFTIHVEQVRGLGAEQRRTRVWDPAKEEWPWIYQNPPPTASGRVGAQGEFDANRGLLRRAMKGGAAGLVSVEEARGWPCLALWCVADSPEPDEPKFAYATRGGIIAREYPAVILPLLPLWPGFAVDTAFWGGAAFVVWSVPGSVRRRSRRRLGRCVACGYELKGLVPCPECGA